MATMPEPVAELFDERSSANLPSSTRRSTGDLPAHPALGRRQGLPDLLDVVQPQARAHPRQPEGSLSITDPIASAAVDRATIQGDARVIEEDPHGGWERLLPIWEKKEPSIVYFLKARVALPLFFERALIEITPRRVLFWPGGDTSARTES